MGQGGQGYGSQAELTYRTTGKWRIRPLSLTDGDSTIELIAMTAPDKAKVKVTLTGGTVHACSGPWKRLRRERTAHGLSTRSIGSARLTPSPSSRSRGNSGTKARS